MKKLNFIALTIILMLIPMLQSCLDDNSNQSWLDNLPDDTRLAIVTIRQKADASPSEFYMTLDDGKTVYPTIRTDIGNPTIKDGQRAFAYLRVIDNQTPEAVDGYDYNAELFRLVNILTKSIIPLTAETADSIGDDRINISKPWIAQGYLTMEFKYYGTYDQSQKHMLNLVRDESKELVDDKGYINLEFRHNAFDYPQSVLGEGIVSFKLDEVSEEMKTAKGIKVRVKTIYDNIQYYIIDFEEETESSQIPTAEQLKSSIDAIKTHY